MVNDNFLKKLKIKYGYIRIAVTLVLSVSVIIAGIFTVKILSKSTEESSSQIQQPSLQARNLPNNPVPSINQVQLTTVPSMNPTQSILPQPNSLIPQGGTIVGWDTQCSGTGTVNLTHVPMDRKDIDVILPLGTLAGQHVTPIDHLYIYPKDMKTIDASPVYSMADGFIVSYEKRSQGPGNGDAVRIVIQHTCTFYSYFDLLTSLSPKLEEQLQAKEMHIPVKAGQEIGRVGKQSLDMAVYNFDVKLTGFVHPEFYNFEPWKIHTDDFFTYFTGTAKSELLAQNLRKVEPLSGKIDYDIPGKLIGNWFLEGTNGYAGATGSETKNLVGSKGYFSGHFSIVPDAITPSDYDVSTGDYNGEPKQFRIVSPSKTPDLVSENESVVYDLTAYPQPGPGGVIQIQGKPQILAKIRFQVLPNNKVKLEFFSAAAKNTEFTSMVKVYER